jgi:hypothetical protein
MGFISRVNMENVLDSALFFLAIWLTTLFVVHGKPISSAVFGNGHQLFQVRYVNGSAWLSCQQLF